MIHETDPRGHVLNNAMCWCQPSLVPVQVPFPTKILGHHDPLDRAIAARWPNAAPILGGVRQWDALMVDTPQDQWPPLVLLQPSICIN